MYHDVVTDFDNIRITNDGMVFVVAFVPKGDRHPAARLGGRAADAGRSGWRQRRPATTIDDATLVTTVPIDTGGRRLDQHIDRDR